MTAGDSHRRAPRPTQAILAAALLATTAFIRVPVELFDASRQDFPGASREILLLLFGSGALAFLVLALAVAWLPSRLRGLARAVLVGLAIYAWIRAGFFPGPSVSLDGTRLTADLSTGLAGLLVPLGGGLFLAWLGSRQRRVVATLLAVLLGGSLVQSVVASASIWRANAPASQDAVVALREWSREGNVLILILDTLQSDVFEDVLEAEPGLREELDGFRFYRAASSSSPTTYLSLPTIHAGVQYDPARSAGEFYRHSISEGSVLNRLADAGYRVSYAMSLAPCPKAVASCLSTDELGHSRGAIAIRDASHLLDLGMYRVLPDRQRRAILDGGLLASMFGQTHSVYRAERDLAPLEQLATSSTVTDSPPTAKMIHSMITHLPAVLQPDCSIGKRRFDRRGAISQARCAFRQVVALLELLKVERAYDASDILLIADHGYGFGSRTATGSRAHQFKKIVGALNPVVLVKPAHERGPLVTSDAPIELADLPRALCGEAECSPSEGLRALGEVDAARTRKVFWYNWGRDDYWGIPQIPKLGQYSIRGNMLKIESWSRRVTAYTPGTLIDFRRGRQNSAPYLGFGWERRLDTHQKMMDPQATVLLQAQYDPTREYILLLEARLRDASPASRTRVRVDVNGATVGNLVSEHADWVVADHRLEIPITALLESPATTIRFSAEGPASDDPGWPGFALQTLELRPLP